MDVTSERLHVLGKFGWRRIDDSGKSLVHLDAICSRLTCTITGLVDQIANKINFFVRSRSRLVHIHVRF